MVYNGCEATVDGSEFSDSSGFFGMGVMVLEGSVLLNNSVISGNYAEGYGGGILAGLVGDVYLELNDTLVEDNAADNDGGGMMVYPGGTVDVLCTGSSKTTSGFLNNTSAKDGGGVNLYSSDVTFESVACDFDSNSSEDVYSAVSGSHDYGYDASFICDSTGCC